MAVLHRESQSQGAGNARPISLFLLVKVPLPAAALSGPSGMENLRQSCPEAQGGTVEARRTI